MSSQNPKLTIFEHFAAVARTLGSAHRLELLELLAQTERSVEELAGLSGLTVANASQHLQQLRRSGLVEARRDGKRVIYHLADSEVLALLGSLRRVTERNVGAVEKVLNSYFRERDSLEPVSRKELLRRMREGLVTVIDTVRRKNSLRVTCLAPSMCRLANSSSGCGNCPATRRSSPTAAAPIACSRTRRSRSFASAVSTPSGLKRAILSGEPRACRLSSQRLAEFL